MGSSARPTSNWGMFSRQVSWQQLDRGPPLEPNLHVTCAGDRGGERRETTSTSLQQGRNALCSELRAWLGAWGAAPMGPSETSPSPAHWLSSETVLVNPDLSMSSQVLTHGLRMRSCLSACGKGPGAELGPGGRERGSSLPRWVVGCRTQDSWARVTAESAPYSFCLWSGRS